MTEGDVREIVESSRLQTKLGISSGSKHFLFALNADPEIRRLIADAAQRRETLSAVYRFATALLAMPGEDCYRHPADISMAVALLVVSSAKPELGRLLAVSMLPAKRTWWTRIFAEQVAVQSTLPTARFRPAAVMPIMQGEPR